MALFDFPLETLQSYQPDVAAPDDFEVFWQESLAETRQHPLNAQFEAVDVALTTLETFDVSYTGYGGQTIKGWFILPKERNEPLPCVVEYIGYGGGRGFAIDWLLFASAGYAHFVMDTRGQGSTWSPGDTPDIADMGSSPQHPGFMTRGILDPKTYYYRRVFCDAVRAVEAAKSHPAVDAKQVAVTGGSQGGGISLAVSGLVADLKAVMPDVPFLCHFKRATTLINKHPYAEIANYLKVHRDKVASTFKTLNYFDSMHFAKEATAPALFSVALMDEICPPSTVFAAYNHYAAQKAIEIYEFNDHEGGRSYQSLKKLEFLKTCFS